MEKKNDLTELQMKHQQQMKEKRDAIRLRKQRTHRLIVRGAIAENAIKGAKDMTDEQFQETLLRAIRKSEAIATSHPQDSHGSAPRKTLRSSPRQSARHHDFRRDV